MRGHEQLLAMRRRGMVPAIVFISCDPDTLGEAGDWQARTPEMAAVVIEPADQPEMLDLRFLVGLLVKVDGLDAERVERVTQACIEAKAARVIASTVAPAGYGLRITGITDTEGTLGWQP